MANRAGMPRVGDVVAGKYRIEEVIGEGGMGAVFAATHALTGKRVALKWMLPELAADQGALQRFMREAQAAGRIDHPNVVDIYDVGEHDGSTFLVMEYLYGEPLTAAFHRGGLGIRQVIQLLLPAMRGVAAAHQMGVIHRDLKPDNIFLCRGADGTYREPKVLDFGISKVSSGADQQVNPRLTRTGAVIGTPYYMSPEQIRGSSEVDARTDVYAFGVILYEALTGRVPFDADAYSALILEIATGTPKRPRELRNDIPAALEEVVLKAMAREPERRYQDVQSLARALEPFGDGVTFGTDRLDPTGSGPRAFSTTATPFTSEMPAKVPVRRGWVGAAATVAVLLVGTGMWLARSRNAPADHVVEPARAGSPPAVAPAPAPKPVVAPHEAPPAMAADAGALRPANPPQPVPELKPEPSAPEEAPRHGLERPSHRRERDDAPQSPHRSRGRAGTLRTDQF